MTQPGDAKEDELKPDLVPLASEAQAEPSVHPGDGPVDADEEFDDLLNLDDPDGAMPSVLTRLALIALGSAAATVLVSFLLIATLPRGTVFDVLVLVTWLSVGVLSVGGLAMLAAGGIAKVIAPRNRTSD